MRIITGALAFFESRAGMAIAMQPGIRLPKPPPVDSLIGTESSAWRPNPRVALRARIGSAGAETLNRVHRKRQRLVLDLDLLDGFSRREFIDGRHRENGLAVIHRLHRQPALGERAGTDAFA